MTIWLVEDDYLQARDIEDSLRDAFPDWSVKRIPTESEFRRQAAEIAATPDSLIVMDVLLRWTDPAPDSSAPPEDVERDGPFFAGFRCLRVLATQPGTSEIPVIVYSVLDLYDIEPKAQEMRNEFNDLRIVQKCGGSELVEALRRRSSQTNG